MHTGEKTRDEEITKGVLHRKYGYLELDKSRPLVYLEGVRGGGRKMGDPVGYRQRGDSGVYATQLLGRNLLIHRLYGSTSHHRLIITVTYPNFWITLTVTIRITGTVIYGRQIPV